MKRAYEFAKVRNTGASSAGRLLVLSSVPFSPAEVGAGVESSKAQAQLVAVPSMHLENGCAPEAAPHSRFGIIVTKRVGNAVMRNLLRRRVREILRAHALPLAYGHYVVVIIRNSAAMSDYAQLEKDFCRQLPRLLAKLQKLKPSC